MSQLSSKKELIDEILTRGVENVYPNVDSLAKILQSKRKLRVYCGYDPTAPTLHIGHAITINKLSQFQALGHEIILLIGDFTAMIGDPTDKLATRKKLTRQEALNNAKNYQSQASAFLDFSGLNPARIKYNSAWHDRLTFRDLIELASNFTVGQMIVRDMFQKRMKEDKPIFLHEFLYPLAQAYDSLALDVDLEVGGNDQTFNMLCGRDLMRAMKNKNKFVLTTKILADESGKKMGKTEGNTVNLSDSPQEMFGKIMSWSDSFILPAYELCTKVPLKDLAEIRQSLKNGDNPRDHKMNLAWEIVKIHHGLKLANQSRQYFIDTFQKKEAPKEVNVYRLKNLSINLLDLLVETKLVSSKGEARRLIEQGGIKINGQTIKNPLEKIKIGQGVLLQRGKRHFIKVQN